MALVARRLERSTKTPNVDFVAAADVYSSRHDEARQLALQ